MGVDEYSNDLWMNLVPACPIVLSKLHVLTEDHDDILIH
jgi:hypothetical protein